MFSTFGEILDQMPTLLSFHGQHGQYGLLFMCNAYLIYEVWFCFASRGPGECVPARIPLHCVESVWPLLKHDN